MRYLALPVLAVSMLLCVRTALPQTDALFPETVTVGGTIYQHTADPKKPLLATPISKQSLLNLFGFPAVKASTTKIFFDAATSSDVLASQDGKTVYGTLFTYPASGDDFASTGGKGVSGGSATMMNGNIHGSYFRAYHDSATAVAGTVTFLGTGALPAGEVIIKATFSYNEHD